MDQTAWSMDLLPWTGTLVCHFSPGRSPYRVPLPAVAPLSPHVVGEATIGQPLASSISTSPRSHSLLFSHGTAPTVEAAESAIATACAAATAGHAIPNAPTTIVGCLPTPIELPKPMVPPPLPVPPDPPPPLHSPALPRAAHYRRLLPPPLPFPSVPPWLKWPLLLPTASHRRPSHLPPSSLRTRWPSSPSPFLCSLTTQALSHLPFSLLPITRRLPSKPSTTFRKLATASSLFHPKPIKSSSSSLPSIMAIVLS